MAADQDEGLWAQNFLALMSEHAKKQAVKQITPVPSHVPTSELTVLPPEEEAAFQAWAERNQIEADAPDTAYDMRGYWKATLGADHPQGEHFPDTFKQHGHPTFSAESQYSRGPQDGGQWIGETLVPPPMPSHITVTDTGTGRQRTLGPMRPDAPGALTPTGDMLGAWPGSEQMIGGLAALPGTLLTPPSQRGEPDVSLEQAQPVPSEMQPTRLPLKTKAAISDVLEGAGIAASPLILAALASAPVATLIAGGVGQLANDGARAAVKKLGGDAEDQRLAGHLAALLAVGTLTKPVTQSVVGDVASLGARGRARREPFRMPPNPKDIVVESSGTRAGPIPARAQIPAHLEQALVPQVTVPTSPKRILSLIAGQMPPEMQAEAKARGVMEWLEQHARLNQLVDPQEVLNFLRQHPPAPPPPAATRSSVAPQNLWRDPSADVPTSAGFKVFKALLTRREDINNALVKYVDAGMGDSPEARALLVQQKENTRLQYALDLDPGGVEGIGLPGGPRDVLVIGGGPGGLVAASNGGLSEFDTLVVEASPTPGGAARDSGRVQNLYLPKGFAAGATGWELAEGGYDAAVRNGADEVLNTRVVGLSYDPQTDLKTVTLSNGKTETARTVVLAVGTEPEHLTIPGADAQGIFYEQGRTLGQFAKGKRAIIVGAGNSGAQAAQTAALTATHVTLIARSDLGKMDPVQQNDFRRLMNSGKVSLSEHAGELARVLKDSTGRVAGVVTTTGLHVPGDALGVFVGARSKTEWLPLEIRRDPRGKIHTNANLETDMPGVFAVGDARVNEATVETNRISTAVGEGGRVVSSIWEYFTRHGYKRAAPPRADQPTPESGRGVRETRPPQWAERDAFVARLDAPDGGFAVHAVTGEEPSTGFSVVPDRSKGVVVPAKHTRAEALAAYLKFRQDNIALLQQPELHIGGWHDPDSGQIFFDVSKNVPTAEEAEAISRANKEKAYFDHAAGKSVPITYQEGGLRAGVTQAVVPPAEVTPRARVTPEGWKKFTSEYPPVSHKGWEIFHNKLMDLSFSGQAREHLGAVEAGTGRLRGRIKSGTADHVVIGKATLDSWRKSTAPLVIAHTHPSSSAFSIDDLFATYNTRQFEGVNTNQMTVFGEDGSWFELKLPPAPMTDRLDQAIRAVYAAERIRAAREAFTKTDQWVTEQFHLTQSGDGFLDASGKRWERDQLLAQHPEIGKIHDRHFRDASVKLWEAVAPLFDGIFRYHLAP